MTTITEDYVSFEIAKLLKEKGFDELCLSFFWTEDSGFGIEYCDRPFTNKQLYNGQTLRPTLQMAMKWLREVHNICITIYPDKEKGYEAVLYNIKDDVEIMLQSFGIYGSHIFRDSYEEACEVTIKYCLENLI